MNESNISRDHIALEAMKIILDKGMELSAKPVGILNKMRKWLYFPFKGEVQDNYIQEISKGAYEIADAMIAEREKGGKQ